MIYLFNSGCETDLSIRKGVYFAEKGCLEISLGTVKLMGNNSLRHIPWLKGQHAIAIAPRPLEKTLLVALFTSAEVASANVGNLER